MARGHRTILFALTLAAPLIGQNVAEDPDVAMIEGSVINIQNSRMIPRATVTLLHLKGTGSKSQRADGSGHFLFRNVEPGIYRLMADRAGFFSDDRKREYQPIFEIAAGEHVKDIPVRLIPSALVSGRVRDEYNDPVPDAEIRILAVQARLGQQYLRVAGKAMTDDRGEYRIAGLHPGKYYLVVEDKSKPLATLTSIIENVNALSKMTDAKGRPLKVDMPGVPDPPYTYAPLFYPDTTDFRQAQSLKLNPGDDMAADFLLISAPVVSIRGKVVNGITARATNSATVAAFWTNYAEGGGIPALLALGGSFEVRGIAPGTYTLRATFTEDQRVFHGEETIEVGERGAQNVQITAMPDFVATGHVRLAGLTEKPRNASIEFVGEGLMPRVRTQTVPPDLVFEAQLRPDRRYRAMVRDLPLDYYLKSVAISQHELAPDNVVVNGLRGDLELILSTAGGHIEGVLTNPRNERTRGSILLIPDVPEPGPPDLFGRTSADSKGNFMFRGVAPGSYRILASENLSLEDEINDPDFLRTIANRGESLIVEENGKYFVMLKLESNDHN
ncbi:MAG: hypothetical protein JWN42_3089 [Candidatus Angelobacter sp.]|nr:hypothetical protein [Candidatus Angelobacter sp.]